MSGSSAHANVQVSPLLCSRLHIFLIFAIGRGILILRGCRDVDEFVQFVHDGRAFCLAYFGPTSEYESQAGGVDRAMPDCPRQAVTTWLDA